MLNYSINYFKTVDNGTNLLKLCMWLWYDLLKLKMSYKLPSNGSENIEE